jgi:isoquinoline 1-oxidoreductase subunit alpha
MNGNICRCGTYLRIRPAIHRAAVIVRNGYTQPTEAAQVLAGKE